MWVLEVKEVTDDHGKPTGLFYLCAFPSPDGKPVLRLCQHETKGKPGHATEDEALSCPTATQAAEAYFPPAPPTITEALHGASEAVKNKKAKKV